jgi:hypothetical protein
VASVKSYNKRLESLRSERSSFIPLWRDLSDYHLAHRGRFLVADRNKGWKRNTKQINNSSRLSARTLASGMMAGITSPARPWFRLSAGDTVLDESEAVKNWLHTVQSIMYRVFSASNTYNVLHMTYAELGVFGTAAMAVYADFDNVIRCEPYTVGSYMIAVNGKNQPDTFYREYDITVTQCVDQFGIENCTNSTQMLWNNGNTEAWITVIHVVEPNSDRDHMSPMAGDKPFRSVYYEYAAGKNNEDKFLRESGFDDMPTLMPRWDLTAGDIYATDCPGMTCLGDTKALQLAEKRKYQALDKIVNPPLQGPASMKNKVGKGGLKPGEVVYNDTSGPGLASIYDFRPDIGAIQNEISIVENRIQRGFYEDLFLMLANSDRKQITAREVAEKHEEKLLMLGPVLERLHTELLDPLIDRTFNILQREGVLPPPPEELADRELNVEYVSVLAQAQRLASTGSIEQLSAYVGQAAMLDPSAVHKIDVPQSIDDYAAALGVNPKIVRSDQQVADLKAADQAAQAQAQAAAQGVAMADTAKTMSETDTGGDNALSTIMNNAGIG